MSASPTCYFNGDLLPYDQISLHISDLLIQRGYGIFDYFRARNGAIPWLEDYTDRLFNSMRLSEIETEMSREQFTTIIHELQQQNGFEKGAFKVIVTGGYSDTLESVTGAPNVLILNVPWNRPPETTFRDGASLARYSFVRPNPEIKTLNYFNTMRLRKKMSQYGAIDVLFHTDTISEASRANVFIVKHGRISTPADNILHGVTRKQVLSLFPGIRVEDVPVEWLEECDEMFIASTSRDITPVVSVEGLRIGNGSPGPFTREVQAAFRERGWME
jgi:branched-subunit amino acid aminotransferase/4-amino-4-deoxychorismate lyase